MNSKRERFIRVAESRVSKVLDTLRLIKNCSSRNNYDYTEKDVETMFLEISKAVKDAKDAYYAELSKNNSTKFKFDN